MLNTFLFLYSVVVQWPSRVGLSGTPWAAAHQASRSLSIFLSLHNLKSIEFVMPSNHLILCCPLLLLSSIFPKASRSFPMSWLFTSGSQNIGASASVLPMNIQGWFPLELTGLIFLLSKGLSRVFSNTTVQNHQFFGTQLSLWSNSSIVHNYWENHSFDYTNLCWQSVVSAF